ncbi:MAG: hypothetical protein L0Z62_14340 [Gemmataceae bacterium]|nr:hypothetical protein [Gemmataceae bacterium]
MAHQIPVVAILMIVQGTLELLMAALLYFGAFFVPALFGQMQQNPAFGPGARPEDLEAMRTILPLVYGSMGTAALIAGVLHLVAGIRNLSYRGRTLGLVALFLGLVSIGTCYCAPTTIGLTIYGLIVYFNAQSIRAFELGQQGLRAEEIRRVLASGDLPPRDEPPLEFRVPEQRPPEQRPPGQGPPDEGIKPAEGPER